MDELTDVINAIQEPSILQNIDFSAAEVDNAVEQIRNSNLDWMVKINYQRALNQRRPKQNIKNPETLTRRAFFSRSMKIAGWTIMLGAIPYSFSRPGYDYGPDHTVLSRRSEQELLDLDHLISLRINQVVSDPNNKEVLYGIDEKIREVNKSHYLTQSAIHSIENKK